MNELQIRQKLERMKDIRRVLGTVTLIAALLAIAMLLAYNFLPVTYLKSPAGTDYEQGFSFPGWQMIFYGFGRQYIMQDHLFDPNPINIVGMVGTLLALIVCTATYSRGRNVGKAVREFIMAAALLYSGLVLGVLIVQVATTAATSGGVYDFKNQYLLNPASSFTALPCAYLTSAVLWTAALVKLGNGVFLLYQKKFALAHPVRKETEAREERRSAS